MFEFSPKIFCAKLPNCTTESCGCTGVSLNFGESTMVSSPKMSAGVKATVLTLRPRIYGETTRPTHLSYTKSCSIKTPKKSERSGLPIRSKPSKTAHLPNLKPSCTNRVGSDVGLRLTGCRKGCLVQELLDFNAKHLGCLADVGGQLRNRNWLPDHDSCTADRSAGIP